MHPLVNILIFIAALLLMSGLGGLLLLAFCSVVCVAAFILQRQHFAVVVKRMRFFFISILLIYAYGTPGEYIWPLAPDFSPSYEGIYFGLMQIERLLISLAALSLLLAANTKERLIAGLYALLYPLQFLGVNVQRFAARLLLTFHYVEQLANRQATSGQQPYAFHHLDGIYNDKAADAQPLIELSAIPYRNMDRCALAVLFMLMLVLSWKWLL